MAIWALSTKSAKYTPLENYPGIMEEPTIYLHEIQRKLFSAYKVQVSASTICRTLKIMGFSRQVMRHVALQQSETLRARFMAEVSLYEPSMLIWLDESGCDG